MNRFVSRLYRRLNRNASVLALSLVCASFGASAQAQPDQYQFTSAISIFTMTNAVAGNAVRAYARNLDGSLAFFNDYPTGGLGVGHGLENQGALALSSSRRFLYVVNPGSDDVSVFRVTTSGLQLSDRVASGGRVPISVAERNRIVYVLNRGGDLGGSDNIQGFRLTDGKLAPIAGTTLILSQPVTDAAQIAISRNGKWIVVTERGTRQIDTFALDANGAATSLHSFRSAGSEPFGFAFRRAAQFYVSESGSNSASGYRLDALGHLTTLNGPVHTRQSATCWLAITPDGNLAYVTNTGSGTISSYRIATDGTLSLVHAVAASTQGGPLDVTVSHDGQYLTTLTTSGNLAVFRIDAATSNLTPVQNISGLPLGSNGIAGF